MSRLSDTYVSVKRFCYTIRSLRKTINKALNKNKSLVNILTQKTRKLNNALERVRRNWRGKIQTLGTKDANRVVRLTRPEYYRLRVLIGKRKGK